MSPLLSYSSGGDRAVGDGDGEVFSKLRLHCPLFSHILPRWLHGLGGDGEVWSKLLISMSPLLSSPDWWGRQMGKSFQVAHYIVPASLSLPMGGGLVGVEMGKSGSKLHILCPHFSPIPPSTAMLTMGEVPPGSPPYLGDCRLMPHFGWVRWVFGCGAPLPEPLVRRAHWSSWSHGLGVAPPRGEESSWLVCSLTLGLIAGRVWVAVASGAHLPATWVRSPWSNWTTCSGWLALVAHFSALVFGWLTPRLIPCRGY